MTATLPKRNDSSPPISPKQCRFIKLLAHLHLTYRRHERALPLLEGLHALFPGDVEVLKMLAWAKLQSHDYPGALENCRAYRDTVGERDEHAPILLLEAHALWGLGEKQAARQTLTTYLENHP